MFYLNTFKKQLFVCFAADRVPGRSERAGSTGRVGVCEGGHPEVRVTEGTHHQQTAGNLPLHQSHEVSPDCTALADTAARGIEPKYKWF